MKLFVIPCSCLVASMGHFDWTLRRWFRFETMPGIRAARHGGFDQTLTTAGSLKEREREEERARRAARQISLSKSQER